jgi:hypothetical protein
MGLVATTIVLLFALFLVVAIVRRMRWPVAGRRFENLIVSDERGTTEVDEVVVTTAGVFVIEKKDFNAWIFGDESDEYWTAVYPNRERHRFQNPIRQNYRHVKALQALLGIRRELIRSIVAFTGRCRLMTSVPENVRCSDYLDYIMAHSEAVLADDEIGRISAELANLEALSDDAAFDRHVDDVHARFSSMKDCPKCGGRLVRRQSRQLGDEENQFMGCSNFPRCRFVKELDAT